AGIGRALDVILPAQRMKSGARPSDLTRNQRECNQTAGIVGSVRVLRHAHAPEDYGRMCARIGARNLPQRVGVNAADRLHFLRAEVLDARGKRTEALDVGLYVLLVVKLFGDNDVE